ncbi:MAG TPA: sigma 54-interacting transcriptional regulator [Polyangiaceae bacterium]|jgi:DNA-binding NtrC family response regulator
MPPREPTGENETRRHGASVEAPPFGLDAVVVEGADTGKRVALDASGGKILVGASALCDLRLADPTVSRRHASIERTDLGVLLTDLGSTNGTYLGDARVVAAYLGEGARIRIGSGSIEVRASDAAPVKARRNASLGRMASSSPRMINVLSLCQRLAPSDMPVVLEGETGTGKELLAENIHEASGRAAHPFVVLDCRTTPGELAEGYLFGEARADGSTRAGIFELAGDGTLLVDEPGDLSLELQAKLLRALDKGVVQRVGDPTPVRVGARILVATSHDFDRLVEEGKLREDLYHRLAGARIEVPPLRRRREDIPALAGEIWTDLGGKGFLPDEFLERFEGYDWPGNVRELERALRRFLVLGDSVSLLVTRTHRHKARPDDAENEQGPGDLLARVLAANLGYSEARERVLEEFERAYLEKALADSGGNVATAAARSGIARRHFQRLRARQR